MKLLLSLLRLTLAIALILACLLAGRWLSTTLLPALPGSILGMLLLTGLLFSGLLKVEWVAPASDLLLRWMSLLFLPIGVGLVDLLGLLQGAWLGLLAVCVLGSLPLFWLCGYLVQKYMRED